MRAEWLRHRFRELAVDRARTILVAMGVMWGSLSLTVVLSFGEELDRAMTSAVRKSGADILIAWTVATTRPYQGLPAGRWIGFHMEDAKLIEERVPGVRAASPEFHAFGAQLEFGGTLTNAGVHGVDACYGELRCVRPQLGGRFINERDGEERRRVAFLGDAVKERIFGSRDAVGQALKVWGTPFTVIGVMEPKVTTGGYEGFDRDKVFIPASTFQAVTGWQHLSYIVAGLASPDEDALVMRRMREMLGPRLGFDPEDTAVLSFMNTVEDGRKAGVVVSGTRILVAIVGVLGMLIALVGVANVMYVMVEERRREIGIQMALGATPRGLAAAFVCEGALLTIAGGVLGLGGSAAVLWLFNLVPLGAEARGYLGEPVVSVATAAAVTAFLGVAGCAAAYWPARRAARLDPSEVLREE